MRKDLVKENIKNGQVLKSELQDDQYELFVKLFIKCLETNIALKTLNMDFATNIKNPLFVKMCKESIENSKSGLQRIVDVENVESFNSIIHIVGENNWKIFTSVLSAISGTFNDDNFYEFDKKLGNLKDTKGEA